jgi:hypothetical protein
MKTISFIFFLKNIKIDFNLTSKVNPPKFPSMPALINEAKVSVTCLFGKIKSDNPSFNTVKGHVRLSHLYPTWPHILVGSIGACRQVWSMGVQSRRTQLYLTPAMH